MLDWLLERDGTALLFAPLASYVDDDHEAIREMMTHPQHRARPVSDGGAHCGLICDASMPTYLLTHWVRDRTRGERVPLEQAVHLQTGRTAAVVRLRRPRHARGRASGPTSTSSTSTRCTLHAPEMVFDLPAGGRRLVQRVDGYRATFVAGVQTYDDGEPTGATPGRLVRFGQHARCEGRASVPGTDAPGRSGQRGPWPSSTLITVPVTNSDAGEQR